MTVLVTSWAMEKPVNFRVIAPKNDLMQEENLKQEFYNLIIDS
jgi:hypothetical protein